VKAESLFGDDMLGEGDCFRSTGLNFRGFLRGKTAVEVVAFFEIPLSESML